MIDRLAVLLASQEHLKRNIELEPDDVIVIDEVEGESEPVNQQNDADVVEEVAGAGGLANQPVPPVPDLVWRPW